MRDWIGMIRRGLRKPPRVIVDRILAELRAEAARFHAPRRQCVTAQELLAKPGSESIERLWHDLAARPYPAMVAPVAADQYEICCPGDGQRILAQAEDALAYRVDLLGSGQVELGPRIDWLKDFKTGFSWPPAYFRDIDYNNPDRPSDVKVPWELSRLQWLIPVGQAYLLTGNARYAEGVRAVLEAWIESNPYAGTVNWACTMEVALRILSWTWFFHVFHASEAWSAPSFREKFLRALYLHVEFAERHIERSDVNGNHYTADAAGMAFGGLFFGRGRDAERWQRHGWTILSAEIQRQVFPDGVDFEASISYHRLVQELFLLPALYRRSMNMPIDAHYRDRLLAMARFTAAYTKPDGTAPLWGDADDARALPFGGQAINDHRYLIGVSGAAFDDAALVAQFGGPREEIFWLLGERAALALPAKSSPPASTAFPEGGFYIMRSPQDHVFIDCGPVGLAGRGGHGHNDCLSFEATLDGVPVISDCGAYLYTASYAERNAFRSTAYHNTPQVDGQEINRYIRLDYLWNLHYDGKPETQRWYASSERDVFRGGHRGYLRLDSPVTPVRTLVLDKNVHALVVHDEVRGEASHLVEIPLHLAPGIVVTQVATNHLHLAYHGQHSHHLYWQGEGFQVIIGVGRISPSYGITCTVERVLWRRVGPVPCRLTVVIVPAGTQLASPIDWAERILERETLDLPYC